MNCFLYFLLVVLLTTYSWAAPSSAALESPADLVRMSKCNAPKAVCPGQGCISCPEIGNQLLKELIAIRKSVAKGTFKSSLNKFIDAVEPNGRAEKLFKDNCCVRIFGIQVAGDVPGRIAYGYIGRAVLPGSFLLGYEGYKFVNPGATIKEFIAELGPDFRGEFFKKCTIVGVFQVPCLTGSLQALRDILNPIAIQNSIFDEAGNKVGLALGQTVGAFTESVELLTKDITKQLRNFKSLLNKCC